MDNAVQRGLSPGAFAYLSGRLTDSVEGLADAYELRPTVSTRALGWTENVTIWRGHSEGLSCAPFNDVLVDYQFGGVDWRLRCKGRVSDAVCRPGLVSVLPSGYAFDAVLSGSVAKCTLHLAPERFEKALDGLVRKDYMRPIALNFADADPFLTAAMSILAAEVQTPTEIGAIYAETLIDSIVLHLVRLQLPRAMRMSQPIAGLPRRALAVVIEYIEQSLEHGVSLDELSALVGFSRSHFCRAFRRSIGYSPHQYLSLRRVERAKHLLSRTATPIAEIAVMCGFSSQAHLTVCFRIFTGTTPSVFRRSTG